MARRDELTRQKQIILNQQQLKRKLSYNPDTGIFIWIENKKRKGLIAGWKDKKRGYVGIRINGINYLAHRLVWVYMTGEWPDKIIDHENGITDDNRFINLKSRSQQDNIRKKDIQRNNTSGYKGVSKMRNKWRATIRFEGKQQYLGSFDSPQMAFIAYKIAAVKFFNNCARW